MALLTLAPDGAEGSASRPDRLTLEEGRTLGTQLTEDQVSPHNHIKEVTAYYKDEWKQILRSCRGDDDNDADDDDDEEDDDDSRCKVNAFPFFASPSHLTKEESRPNVYTQQYVHKSCNE